MSGQGQVCTLHRISSYRIQAARLFCWAGKAGFKASAALLALQADLTSFTARKLWSGILGMGQLDSHSHAPAVALLRCGVLSRLVCWAAENCALPPHPLPVGVLNQMPSPTYKSCAIFRSLAGAAPPRESLKWASCLCDLCAGSCGWRNADGGQAGHHF